MVLAEVFLFLTIFQIDQSERSILLLQRIYSILDTVCKGMPYVS